MVSFAFGLRTGAGKMTHDENSSLGAAAWPLAARAQRPMPVIGYLSGRTAASEASMLVSVRRGLGDVGYAEGRMSQSNAASRMAGMTACLPN